MPVTGKWTTYRSMSKDAVDKVVEVGAFEETERCQTDGYILEGGDGWYPTLFIRLVQDYGLDIEVNVHLFIKWLINFTKLMLERLNTECGAI